MKMPCTTFPQYTLILPGVHFRFSDMYRYLNLSFYALFQLGTWKFYLRLHPRPQEHSRTRRWRFWETRRRVHSENCAYSWEKSSTKWSKTGSSTFLPVLLMLRRWGVLYVSQIETYCSSKDYLSVGFRHHPLLLRKKFETYHHSKKNQCFETSQKKYPFPSGKSLQE